MKWIAMAFFIAFAGAANAIVLSWDADTDWDETVGVRIYCEDVTGTTSFDFDQTPNIAEIPDSNFSPGTDYNFWATAFSGTEESDDSNIVSAYYNVDGVWASDNNKSFNNKGSCFIEALQ